MRLVISEGAPITQDAATIHYTQAWGQGLRRLTSAVCDAPHDTHDNICTRMGYDEHKAEIFEAWA